MGRSSSLRGSLAALRTRRGRLLRTYRSRSSRFPWFVPYRGGWPGTRAPAWSPRLRVCGAPTHPHDGSWSCVLVLVGATRQCCSRRGRSCLFSDHRQCRVRRDARRQPTGRCPHERAHRHAKPQRWHRCYPSTEGDARRATRSRSPTCTHHAHESASSTTMCMHVLLPAQAVKHPQPYMGPGPFVIRPASRGRFLGNSIRGVVDTAVGWRLVPITQCCSRRGMAVNAAVGSAFEFLPWSW